MNPLLQKIAKPLIPLTLIFSAATSNADPVITVHNSFLNKDFPGVDCAVRKVDMCEFGKKTDGNNVCRLDDFLPDVGGDLKKANGLAIIANVKHGAVFHREDCVGQNSRNILINIYNAAREVLVTRQQLNNPTGLSSDDIDKLKKDERTHLSSIDKFINGALGEKDGLVNMVEHAKLGEERLNDPQGLINALNAIIPTLQTAHDNGDMNEILRLIPPAITGNNANVFNGQCAIFSSIQQCNQADLSQ